MSACLDETKLLLNMCVKLREICVYHTFMLQHDSNLNVVTSIIDSLLPGSMEIYLNSYSLFIFFFPRFLQILRSLFQCAPKYAIEIHTTKLYFFVFLLNPASVLDK